MYFNELETILIRILTQIHQNVEKILSGYITNETLIK